MFSFVCGRLCRSNGLYRLGPVSEAKLPRSTDVEVRTERLVFLAKVINSIVEVQFIRFYEDALSTE